MAICVLSSVLFSRSRRELICTAQYKHLYIHTYLLDQFVFPGGGSVVCFLTGDFELSKHIVTNTKLFKITVSFGSVNSLISVPGQMSHASIPAEVRSARFRDMYTVCMYMYTLDIRISTLYQAYVLYVCMYVL